MGKMEHPDHPCEGYSGYMMTQADYAFYSTTRCQDPADVEKYFIVPTTAITNTDKKLEERKWQERKNVLDTFCNMLTALQQVFKRSIYPAYHSGGMINIGMARQRFVNDEPPAILEHLKRLYGTPILHELYQAILSPNNPMDRNQSMEVMLRTTE